MPGTGNGRSDPDSGADAGLCRVLILGSSSVLYSESGPQGALPALLAEALTRDDPARRWACEAQTLFHGPRMAERAAGLVETARPDAVVLWLAASQFVDDSVVLWLRDRFPWSYAPALAIARWWKRLAGGGREGAPTPRGWLFRAPRWFLTRLLGTAPEVPLPDAIRFATETLERLRAREDLAIIVKQPSLFGAGRRGRTSEEDRRRTAIYNQAISGVCSRYHIPVFDRKRAYEAAGMQMVEAEDTIHRDVGNRRFEAGLLAGWVLEAIGHREPGLR